MTSLYNILDDLVKMLVRAFYTDEYIVIVDTLLRQKKRVKEEEIANLLHVPYKYCRKILLDLRADSILKSQEVKEEPKPGERTVTTQLWYLDYSHIIDVIKYKMFMIRKQLDTEKVSKIDLQYKCSACNKMFTAYDIPKLLTPEGELCCDNCDGRLTEERNGSDYFSNQTRHQANMLGQLDKLVEQLKKTDGKEIPLFARDLANDDADQGSDYKKTINTGSSTGPVKTEGAFGGSAATQDEKGWLDPSSNVEIFVDIYDSDNIESGHLLSSTSKKENKKPIQAVPPWLLPKSKTQETSTTTTTTNTTVKNVKQESNQTPINLASKPQVMDQVYFDEYLNKHYKQDIKIKIEKVEQDEKQTDKKQIIDEQPTTTNSNSNSQQNINLSKKPRLEDTTPPPIIFIQVSDRQIPILEVTDEDQEMMTAQEYDNYNVALYDYAQNYLYN